VNLRRFNLNLLPVLEALLECRNVTRAGERLGLSQPATSAALSKLREAFKDDLLVMVGREMKLTPKAERLGEPLRQLLALLEVTFEPEDFNPSQWAGEFIIATADYVSLMVLPELLKRVEAEAPKLTIRITAVNRGSVAGLRSDEIDLIIAPPQVVGDPTLMTRSLFADRFVCAYWREEGKAPPVITPESYLERRHVTTSMDPILPGSLRSNFAKEIDALRSSQRNLATLPNYSLLPFLLLGTPHFGLLQERLVKMMQAYLPIDYVEPPTEIPPIEVGMIWNPRVNHDPAHIWVRQTLADIGARLAH